MLSCICLSMRGVSVCVQVWSCYVLNSQDPLGQELSRFLSFFCRLSSFARSSILFPRSADESVFGVEDFVGSDLIGGRAGESAVEEEGGILLFFFFFFAGRSVSPVGAGVVVGRGLRGTSGERRLVSVSLRFVPVLGGDGRDGPASSEESVAEGDPPGRRNLR